MDPRLDLAITQAMRHRVQWIFRPRTPAVPRERLEQQVVEACRSVPAELAPRLKVTTTPDAPQRWTVIPFSSRPVALVSLDTPDRDRLHAAAMQAGLDRLHEATFERFDVATSTPVEVAWTPAVGEPSPGVELLTLFRRTPGLDDETFLQRWHGVHTPMSIEIHPLRGYIRNVVQTRWPADATPLDGIVEEYFDTRRDLLNPAVFFGGALRMIPNMVRVAWDIRGFIDLATIETYWVTERWLRVEPG